MPDDTAAARARWRAAEDRLYPTLIGEPAAYRRGVAAVMAVVAELRARTRDLPDLLAVEAEPADVVAAACPDGAWLPVDLLVAVACGIRDREIRAQQERARREGIVAAAHAAGRRWAVLEGAERPDALADGAVVTMHLSTGAVVTAAVDPWSGDLPFTLHVVAGDGQQHAQCFRDRAEWLAAYERCRHEIEGRGRASAQPGTS